MNNREIELQKLGFVYNKDQESYHMYKHDGHYYVDTWTIPEYTDEEWSENIEAIKQSLKWDKIKQTTSYDYCAGQFSVRKKYRQLILDEYNKYNSHLKQLNSFKLDKTVNQEARIKLEGKVEVLEALKTLLNKL